MHRGAAVVVDGAAQDFRALRAGVALHLERCLDDEGQPRMEVVELEGKIGWEALWENGMRKLDDEIMSWDSREMQWKLKRDLLGNGGKLTEHRCGGLHHTKLESAGFGGSMGLIIQIGTDQHGDAQFQHVQEWVIV